jgi:molybdate transport system ATP-binding protein
MIALHIHKTLHGAGGDMRLEFDADVAAQSLCALVGPSGAGKTSLLRMLAGLTDPDGGRIVVNGVTWFDAERKINLPAQQRSIGFVFQDYALFPNLSVRENIAYGAGKNEAAWINELLGLTDLGNLQQQRPATLSGGQKQRVALARALARRPALLLLDEPLSALDSALRGQLQQELALLHARCGLTTLLVSHDVGEVFRLADKVLILEHGRIVRAGSPAEVFVQAQPEGNARAQVLALHGSGAGRVLSLLIGNEIVDVQAGDACFDAVAVGDQVVLAARPLGLR